MTRQEKIDLASLALMGLATAFVLWFLGAPVWGAVGFGYLAFLLGRLL